MSTRDELIKDLDRIENSMIRIDMSYDSNMWQRDLLWAICKVLYDILIYLLRKEQSNV